MQEIFIWGNNSVGQLGNQETNTAYNTPLLNKLSILIDSISCGEEHTLILTKNRQVYAMGSNNYGALGIGIDDYELVYPEPVFIKSISHLRVNKIASGWNHNVAILECGSLYVWGRGDNGQLGIDDQVNLLEPENVEIQINGTWVGVRDASCGLRHTVVVTTNNVAMSTGNNDSGQLGLASRQRECQFQLVEIEDKIYQVACGVSHTLFLSYNQKVYSCGSNNLYQLGIGKQIRMAIEPQQIHDLSNIVQVAAGNHSGALSENGHLYLWGQGSFGSVDKPLLFNQDRFQQIAIGGTTGGGINQNGQLYMWGSNSMGQLGVGDNENRIEPIRVNKIGVQCISIGQGFAIGIGLQRQNMFTLQNTLQNQSFEMKEVDEEQEQDSEIEPKQQQNELISMDLLISEKEYLAKTLEIESQERMSLEKINRELKNKIYELTDGNNGVNQQNIRLREKEQQITLLNNRLNELNDSYNEQNEQLITQRKQIHNLQQELEDKNNQNNILLNKQNDIDYLIQQKNQELECTQIQVMKAEEHFKVYHIQEQEQIKQLQLQINDLNIQLIHEREMKDKLSCTYNQEKHNHQSLQSNYATLQDKFNKLSNKSQILSNQLENSLVQHSKLSDALQMALHRIESLQSNNSKLMSDLSLLRTSLYSNSDNLNSSNMQPMEVQAIVQLNQQLAQVNTQLQNKIKQKDMELIKLKNYINNNPNANTSQNININSNSNQNQSNVSNRYQDSVSKQSHHSSHHEPNSPVGKTISELLESAHKHAKFMKRILKDIDQDDENDCHKSLSDVKTKVARLQQSDVLKTKNNIL